MRTQALAKPEVGDFLSKHFVAVHDKVGTFTVTVGPDGKTPNRNGGNVAAFFCTPAGDVIHAVAGPRTGEAFLAEAQWATAVYAEIRKQTTRMAPAERVVRSAAALKQAHAAALEVLKKPNVNAPEAMVSLIRHTPSADAKLKGLENAGLKQREQVHGLLKTRAFEPLATIGPEVYTKILGETVTTDAVKLNNSPESRQTARPGKSLLDFYGDGGLASEADGPAADRNGKSAAPPLGKAEQGSRKSGSR